MKKKISFPKTVSLRTYLVSIIFIAIILLSFANFVLSQTSGDRFTISPGVYPGAPSYTIWREGSNYYAKDLYGKINYFGSNASQVLQNAINDGSTILIRGEILLLAKIVLEEGRTLFGFGRYRQDTDTIVGDGLRGNFSGALIEMRDHTKIFGLAIINKNTDGDGILASPVLPDGAPRGTCTISNVDVLAGRFGVIGNPTVNIPSPELIVENSRISNIGDVSGSIGIYSKEMSDVEIKNNIIRGFEIGIKLERSGNRIIGNHIYKWPSSNITKGIVVTKSYHQIVGNFIEGSPTEDGILMEGAIGGIEISCNHIIVASSAYGIRYARTNPGWMTRVRIVDNLIGCWQSNPNPAVELVNVTKVALNSRIFNTQFNFLKSHNTIRWGSVEGTSPIYVAHNFPLDVTAVSLSTKKNTADITLAWNNYNSTHFVIYHSSTVSEVITYFATCESLED